MPPEDVGLEVQSPPVCQNYEAQLVCLMAKLLAVKYTHMITDSYADMKWAVLINCQTQIFLKLSTTMYSPFCFM